MESSKFEEGVCCEGTKSKWPFLQGPRMYNSGSKGAITPVMQKFHGRSKARDLEKRGGSIEVYEMLKDSPQPHCSAGNSVSTFV